MDKNNTAGVQVTFGPEGKNVILTPPVMQDNGRTVRLAPIKTKWLTVEGASCIGGRSENQDSLRTVVSEDGSVGVMTVCDGMGGMNGGRTASVIAVDTIISLAVQHIHAGHKFSCEVVRDMIEKANEMVYNTAADNPELRGMGTTATLVVVTPEAAFVGHVGDSRIYLLHKGSKAFRTFDHSKVFEMVEAGILTEEEARCSGFSNIITAALGIRPKVNVSVDRIPYRSGDRFVICSDGIWNCRPEPEMIRMFAEIDGTEKEVEYLIKEIDATGMKKGGAHDNLTCIVADVFESSDFQYSLSRRMSDRFNRGILGKIFCRKKPAASYMMKNK